MKPSCISRILGCNLISRHKTNYRRSSSFSCFIITCGTSLVINCTLIGQLNCVYSTLDWLRGYGFQLPSPSCPYVYVPSYLDIDMPHFRLGKRLWVLAPFPLEPTCICSVIYKYRHLPPTLNVMLLNIRAQNSLPFTFISSCKVPIPKGTFIGDHVQLFETCFRSLY